MRACRTISAVLLSAVVAAGMLTGCAGPQQIQRTEPTQRAEPVDRQSVRRVSLTAPQVEAVRSGVKQMLGTPETIRFARVTALSLPGTPGIHVCGHVQVRGADGKDGDPTPYYVELREVDGQPVAERGQIGINQPKTAQVSFLCRRHRADTSPTQP